MKTPQTNDSLSKAIAYLGAVEVAPGPDEGVEVVQSIGETTPASLLEADRRFDRMVGDQTPNGCWEFTGSLKNDRYPGFRFRGRVIKAATFAYIRKFGSLPKGQCVLHTCDNTLCVRPDHLFAGTHQDNMRDMAAKGRAHNSRKTHCDNGHPFDTENTYEYERKDGRKRRACKACRTLHGLGVTLKDGRYYAKNGNPLPEFWSPDQRFAWRETQSAYRGAVKDKKGGLVLIASPAFDADNVTRLRPPHWRRITADLTTGAEVPACD